MTEEKSKGLNINPEGSFSTKASDDGLYIITAQYKDNGGLKAGPLTGENKLVLRSTKIVPEDFDEVRDVKKDAKLTNVNHGGYARLKNIDLKNIESMTFRFAPGGGGRVELRCDSVQGKLVGDLKVKIVGQNIEWDKWWKDWTEVTVPVTDPGGVHDLYFCFINEVFYYGMMDIEWIKFNLKKD